MITTIEKVKRLEQYLVMNSSIIDPVLDKSIDKLLERESNRILELKANLVSQLSEFEKIYSMTNSNFYQSYESGEMGDDMDFMEWAATIEMLTSYGRST
ncbi:hypothetical protein QUF74_01375 [Candidatus Halobeggiatoa sp. HSG11]|nr:hypothetical protein [Candidatus Halobeggiatoa sp. HSG11]